MPRVLLHYDTVRAEYSIHESWDWPLGEYDTVVFMKASHFRNIKRNDMRWNKDQEFLNNFFIEAQKAGREICER